MRVYSIESTLNNFVCMPLKFVCPCTRVCNTKMSRDVAHTQIPAACAQIATFRHKTMNSKLCTDKFNFQKVNK